MIAAFLDATPIRLAGLVTLCATVALVTNHMDSDPYTNVILTILGYAFGNASAKQVTTSMSTASKQATDAGRFPPADKDTENGT